MPGCTAAVVEIAPVLGLSEKPAGHAPLIATVALPVAPRVAGKPLTLSLAATLAIGVDGVPETDVPASVTGRMFALTIIVAVVLAHLAGVFLSHNRYMTA